MFLFQICPTYRHQTAHALCHLFTIFATYISYNFVLVLLEYTCYFQLVRVECMRTNVVRALATKLGSILSFHALTFLPEGVCLQF